MLIYINLSKTKRNLLYVRIGTYRAVNMLYHSYNDQPVNDV
jgi:hypothetical protein